MARYVTPKVFYQSSINANTAVEVMYIKSLSWANRTNNNGNFDMVIPADTTRTRFTPALGGFVRLDPGDTMMRIRKRERICDEKGNFWWKLGGEPTQQTDDVVRDAKNRGFYFRYVYNGVNAEQYREFRVGTPATTINKGDVLHSSVYEDNLGGFFEEVMIDPGHPGFPGIPGQPGIPGIPAVPSSTWGTEVIGAPEPSIGTETVYGTTSVTIGANASTGWDAVNNEPILWWAAGTQDNFEVSTSSQRISGTTGYVPTDSVGNNSGPNGRMDRVTYNGSWIASEVTENVTVQAPWTTMWVVHRANGWTQFSQRGSTRISVRRITLKSRSTYLSEMRNFLNSIVNNSGTIPGREGFAPIPPTPNTPPTPAVPPTFRRTFVEGGHAGYNFALKSRGEVEKRYKVDFNLGDTIAVNDTRLNVVYTGVVSGAVETLDSNGYSVEVEIGTLGATLEQRVQKVI